MSYILSEPLNILGIQTCPKLSVWMLLFPQSKANTCSFSMCKFKKDDISLWEVKFQIYGKPGIFIKKDKLIIPGSVL